MKEMKCQKYRIIDVLHSGEYKGRKFAILNLGVHPTAYVELKAVEVQKSSNYDDYDLNVHGGFTFLGEAYWNKEDKSKYIGWDYAHCDDFSGIYIDDNFWHWKQNTKQYSTQEIFEEVKSVIDQFEKAKWVDVTEPHFVLKIKED